MLARSILVAAALALSAPVSAQVIFTENFNDVISDPFIPDAPNTSERWASTLYGPDPIDTSNQWEFFENSYLAQNGVTGDKAILLNEASGDVNGGVAMKTPGLEVIEGQLYSLSFEHWGDNQPGVYNFQVDIDGTVLLPIVTRAFLATGTGSFMTQVYNFIAPDDEVVITFTGFTGTAGSSGIIDNIAVALIPEPGTYALLLAGLGLMGFVATRRRQVRRLAA